MATTTKLVELFNADETIAALSTQAFVEAAYENLLGLSGDFSNKDARVAYWVAKIDAGLATTDFAATFLAAAAVQGDLLTDAEFAVNTATLVAVAALDETDLTLAAVKAAAVAAVEESGAETPDENAGETFTLTTGAEEVTGTAANDTIEAVASALSSARTLDVTDVVDGGEGSDTLNVDMQSNFTGFTTGSLANVEVVALSNEGSVARTFTATGVSGVEEYQLTGAVNLASQKEITTVTAGARTADLSVAYASKVTDGTADVLDLSISDFGTADDASTTANEETNVDVTVAGIETLNVTATGTNIVDLTNAASKNVTIAGEGSVKVIDVSTATKSIDGSALTSALTLSVGRASGITTVATGSGNDQLSVVADDDVTANATLDGGEGTDTLVITTNGAATTQFTQGGFETVQLGSLGGALTMSLKNTTDVESVVALNTLDENVTLAGAGSDLSYSLRGANANTDTLTSDAAGTATVTVDTPASTATTASPSTNALNLSLTKASAVSLTVDSAMDYEGKITATEASSVEVAINGETSGTAEVEAAKATSVAITAVAQNSVLVVDAVKATDLNISNAKNLSLTTGSILTAVESLVSAGAGNLTVTNLDALNQATISNTGTVTLGTVGSTSLDYSSNITSTGASSFIIGDATNAASTSNQAITLNVTGVTGTIDINGDVLAGTGSVDLTFGAGSTVALDAVSGKNVTIDASEVLGAVTYADDITASGNVTILGSELNANDLDGSAGNIVLTGTAQTVSYTGGIGNDTVLIDGATSTTSITVTGDFGIGTDSLAVDASVGGVNDATAAYIIDITGASSYDTATLTLGDAAAATVKLGSGSDADTIQWTGAQKATITGFDTTEDTLNFDAVSAQITGTNSAVAVGGVAAITDGSTYVIADGATSSLTAGTETITDYNDLTDVAAYLAERFTSMDDADEAVFVINDLVADKTYVYHYVEADAAGTDANTIASADLSIIGVVTEESGAALVVGDIA